METRGIGVTDFLVLALLAVQLALGALALAGREPGPLAEIVWAPALVLFLFAYIYARGANMDYMQRFVAMKGQIQLAQSTAVEQMYALLRFAPLLIVDGALIARRALRALREAPAARRRLGRPRRLAVGARLGDPVRDAVRALLSVVRQPRRLGPARVGVAGAAVRRAEGGARRAGPSSTGSSSGRSRRC